MAHALVPILDRAPPALRLLVLGLSQPCESDLRACLPPDSKLDGLGVDELKNGSRLANRIDSYDALLLNGASFPRDLRVRSVSSALSRLFREDPRAQTVVLVPSDDIETLRVALDAGARDILDPLKGNEEIAAQLRAAARMRRVLELCADAEPTGNQPEVLGQMIGVSPEMRRIFSLMRRVASTQVAVLVTGASGTGKELAARAIHEFGARANGPFVSINCAAISEPQLEAELFGHQRDASGQTQPGRVEVADGGTLFLDEIGELTPPQQGKLLRFLEDHVVQRTGGRRGTPIDVRVIAATKRDLAAEVQRGAFREDLYYRLAVFHIALPPLKDRGDDAICLARRFLDRNRQGQAGSLLRYSWDAEEALRNAPWPGNVRELINRVQRAVVVAEDPLIRAQNLGLAPPARSVSPRPATLREARRIAEVDCILRALEQSGWNKTDAARHVGLSRTQLYEIMNRNGIVEP